MSQIEVLYFAAARERVGRSDEFIAWRQGLTVEILVDELLAVHPPLAELMPYIRIAVNERFVSQLTRALEPGDTVALIPPVSGGQWRYIVDHEIDPELIAQEVYSDECGAVVVFSGRVRNRTNNKDVLHLDYESYGSMAERMLNELVHSIQRDFPKAHLAVQHRVGHLKVGEVAVVVAVSAPHRSDAFDACRRLIDELKAEIPIFKKEACADGSTWVGLGG